MLWIKSPRLITMLIHWEFKIFALFYQVHFVLNIFIQTSMHKLILFYNNHSPLHHNNESFIYSMYMYEVSILCQTIALSKTDADFCCLSEYIFIISTALNSSYGFFIDCNFSSLWIFEAFILPWLGLKCPQLTEQPSRVDQQVALLESLSYIAVEWFDCQPALEG